jgi:hypothetical protein
MEDDADHAAVFYHGTRAALRPGDTIEPADVRARQPYVHLTPNLDAAIWEAEIAVGDALARVYVVEPTGPIENAAGATGAAPPHHPWMSYRARTPLRVVREITDWPLYHGTRADLRPGDLIEPGQPANYGSRPRTANFVYFARTLDAAAWGAELASGEGRERIYTVEPLGPIEDDPNLTNKRFRGNPTKSFRSREPLRVTGEVTHWQGHSPEALEAMKQGLARLEQLGVEPLDD